MNTSLLSFRMKEINAIPLATYNKNKQYGFLFMFSFLLAASFFLPYVIQDGGPFYFYGDYTVQQIPFYAEAHRAVTSGDFLWNWNTDLGANFIGSYSFYLLGSPFFWLTMPFPDWSMAYVLPWLLCLKFAFASVFAFAFIKRFVKNIEYAFIAAILYAFSSYGIYNIFFNHFHEMIVLFPLLLWSLEKLLEDKKYGFFAAAVFLNALANYYFFIAECVFLVIYFFIRVINGSWKKLNPKLLFILYFEAILGVCMAAVLIIPSYLTVVQIGRSTSKLGGWDLLFYNEVQLYGNILASFFMPAELPARPNLFPSIGAKWASMAAWLPMFGLTGVVAWVRRRKRDWLGKLLMVLGLMCAIPVLNSSFQLFSNNFYTRWFFMFVLMLSLATAMAFDKCKTPELMRGFGWTTFLTILIALPVGLIVDTNKKNQIGLSPSIDRYWVYILILAICLIVTYYLIKIVKKDHPKFFTYTLISLTLIISLYANVYMIYGRTLGYEPAKFTRENINARKNINLPNLDNVRSDVLDGMDNQTLFWQIPTIQAFHSVVPGSIMEFYPSVGVTRDVGSRPEASHVWLRSLLSTKYLFDPKNQDDIYTTGWVKLGIQNNFTVWENTNYIPLGFTYENYVTKTNFESVDKNSREKLLINAILLDDEQINQYSSVLTPIDSGSIHYFSDEEMAAACEKRRNTSVADFKRDKTGFEASIRLEKDNLVFFSVPYEKGWTATVNGQPAKIEKVNNGFMAVLCKAGEVNKIRFNYFTPGLKIGLLITIISFAVYILYYFFFMKQKRNLKDIKKAEVITNRTLDEGDFGGTD